MTSTPGEKVGNAQEELPDHIDDVTPVVDAHRDQSAEMQQDGKEHVQLLRVLLRGEKVLKQRQVAGAGDGQKLRHALQETHGNGKEIVQRWILPISDLPPLRRFINVGTL